ncbi:uncharacterized protein LOC18448909 [Amborella trichopoda]|uniref:Uncharacterized protein n=1 Tax=Amborella trichopoda TaxID=13333 RepID=U5DIT0_AMBTC|nr:uncharacterized protein LOC18448909 [Amborella trichopoda]ERN20493.1 hypothetical protein AMTR_s00068p00173710 [Amborella trichopoda]|eukprot:XP_006859026.1 uncharacterized protein LOC18448909 [Amborella trichopoda]
MEIGFMEEEKGEVIMDWGSDGEEGSADLGNEGAEFWQEQHRLLEEVMSRGSSFEGRVRKEASEAVKKARERVICICSKVRDENGCRSCIRRDVVCYLQKAAYDSALCKSKWRSSPSTPPGEHEYIDVVQASTQERRAARVVIELDFRAEFEMARGNNEYNRLVARLPELYVGKPERLRTIVKAVCSAAKQCMKENKMHIAPWRRHKYMHNKWLGPYKRTNPSPFSPSSTIDTTTYSPTSRDGDGSPLRKMRASMLTFDLLHSPTSRAVAVV